LVTGGSGFVGAHCIIQCLNASFHVRTTVRSSKRENDVREMLKAGEATNLDKLTFAVADLTKDEGWKEAVEGCTYVLHVASPFPPGSPKDENDLIIPAREGTRRVLRAARDAGVKRVVVTSSFAAIGYGRGETTKPFTEEMWTDPTGPGINPYLKSKTLAERAAWDFIEKEGGSLELSVINPTGIFGPVLGPDFATSIQLVQRMLNGALPGCPQLSFGVVDVRDVADLHLRAMTNPKAKGERFLCVSPPPMTVLEISLALRERMGNTAKRSPTRVLPNFLLRLIAFFDPAVALILPELGQVKDVSNDKAKNLLGWQPRSNVDALVATAESLIKFNLIKKT
jgi:nucleoside-diphosphate-sugar epimerase